MRFFGGWEFAAGDELRPDLARYGYRGGVSMGGTLSGAGDRAPAFPVAVSRDPEGANLDRIQIVKVWVDSEGATREKVYNVAVSDGRRIRDNRVEPVGSTVDVAAASYRNAIGNPTLAAVWHDPDFDPDQRAFY